jgi:acyl-CoA synthetase (AMP-forming)/AMP-acid ligase II
VAPESILDIVEAAASAGGVVHLPDAPDGLAVGDLWTSAHAVARRLRAERRAATVVAGWLTPSTGSLSALLGCWIAGRAFVSLPHRGRGVGVEAHERVIERMLAASGAAVVLGPDGEEDGRTEGLGDRARPPLADARPPADGPGLVQFTSGTTGDPRAVALGMDQLGTNARSIQTALGTTASDIFFSWLPLSHDMGLVGMFLASLAAFGVVGDHGSGSLWIRPPETFLLDPVSWLRDGAAVGGTVTMAPNFALDLAVARHAKHGTPDLSALRCVVVGAETVRRATLQRAEDELGPAGLRPGVLAPGYGLAEATLGVTTVRPGERWRTRPDPSGTAAETDVVSVGRPLPGVRVRIGGTLDWGPIEVASPSVGRLTPDHAQRVDAEGWLTTGDHGFLADGELHFVGRGEGRIVVAGRTLDTEGLRTLLGDVPGVRPGCCAVVPGEVEGYVVVLEPTADVTREALPALCQQIARRSVSLVGATPADVLVVERGALLKTPSGKIRQPAIAAQLRAGDLRPEFRLSPRRSGR